MFRKIRKRLTFESTLMISIAAGVVSGCDSNNMNSSDPSIPPANKELSVPASSSSLSSQTSAAVGGPSSVEASPYAHLIPVDYQQWQDIKRENTPNILVVDMWASWCVPCLERFPAMVNMSDKYSSRGVQFLSLSLDDREDLGSMEFADQFLSKQSANFPHYFLDENILDGFEKLELQTVPAVDIFDREGKLIVRLTGDNPNKQFTEEDIEQQIQSLL